jgi:hypothetical protein
VLKKYINREYSLSLFIFFIKVREYNVKENQGGV